MGKLWWIDTSHENYECQNTKKQQQKTEESYNIHAKIYDKWKRQRIVFRSKHSEN
jgi:hypothetical protein